MATVAKDFKVKNGLIVEGSTGTINNYDILTKKTDDQNYIIGLIGGTATDAATANTVVKRDGNASFSANVITADLVGDVTGQVSDISNFDTDDLTEGTNKYFSNSLARQAISGSGVMNYNSTTGDIALSYNVGLTENSGKLDVDRTTVDTWYDAAGSATSAANTAYNNAIAYSEDYTDNAISALVDGAPGLLDTLNELAAAIGDDENFATTLTSLVGTKQNTLTAGSNIDITGNTISVTGVDLAGAADTAYNNAISYVDNLDTDDIAEGTAQYFTNTRAVAALVTPITGGTQTNITVTYDAMIDRFSFVAENGVADSTTDDLTQGSTNLYFTNALAVAALEGVTPDFPAVEIASVAKQVAAEASVPTASTNTAVSWAKADYRSAEFLVKIANGSHTDVSKVILTLDTSDNVAITEYAMVGTNGSLGSVSADVSGSDVRLRVTTSNNNSTVAAIGTLLK